MHKLPPGAAMTLEKAARIRERTAIEQIRSMRLWSLLKRFRTAYYIVLCPYACDLVPHAIASDTDRVSVVQGHPVYALLYSVGCRAPTFWEVSTREVCTVDAYHHHAVQCAHACLLRPIRSTADEWSPELMTLMAEFHPLEEVRRLAVQILWALGHRELLREIAQRAVRDSYAEWLATKLAQHPAPWNDWVLRHCHLKVGTFT